MKSKLIFILFFLYSALSSAQYNTDDNNIESIILEVVQENQELDYEEVYEALIQIYSDPIDLNIASKEDLESLYILKPLQINNFLEYRNLAGPFVSIYELQSIPSFDPETIRKVLPFVYIKDKSFLPRNLFREILTNRNHYLLMRTERTLENKKGFIEDSLGNKAFTGGEQKIYFRYRNTKARQFSYGFTMEKDAGEKKFNDFTSYHLALYNKGKVKSALIGDYQVQFGQGLILGAGFSLGKGSETILTVKRNNTGIRPYTSSGEYNFFRGASSTIRLKSFDLSAFVSHKQIDGNTGDSINSEKTFTPVTTGYHRTTSESAKRKNIQETITGGNISFSSRNKKFHIGITSVATYYNEYLLKNPEPYNRFDFSGKENFIYGLDCSYQWKNFYFFGESGMSSGKGKGIVSGFISTLSSSIDVSFLYRNYEKKFHSLYGNAFGENTDNKNEKGIYWGIKLKIAPKIILNAYYDHFYFPWLKYQVDAPSEGYEYLFRLNYIPSKTILIYLQFRQEDKEKNLAGNSYLIDYPVNSLKRNGVFNFEIKATPSLFLRTKIQCSSYRQIDEPTFGFLILQDVSLNYKRFTIAGRFSVFETDDFENRQYTYERDVLYNFSIPFYYGKGIRTYFLLKYKLSKKLELWLKYSRTNYRDKQIIGSGPDEIQGNRKTDIKAQLRYNF
ncbi:MAG: helix-hairpin-helix domain-containing protein [Cytophagaceae bacterium]|nr:helix-hairpin-helix domain-containing protein [Cytophagaceae bacterium]